MFCAKNIIKDTLLASLWAQSLKHLENDLNDQQFHTWIRPLQAIEEDSVIRLLAPSSFILDWVNKKLMDNIRQAVAIAAPVNTPEVKLEIGDYAIETIESPEQTVPQPLQTKEETPKKTAKSKAESSAASSPASGKSTIKHGLNSNFTFDTFVEGKANQLAAAAARQVSENPGGAYNPFFIYGGVGLGKTHLMHAIGNQMIKDNPKARVVYLHSERFVADMVNALRHNKIDEFKRFYRSLDALLIDDIQFFANKEQSQEEFFHTFNTLLEGNKQVILTSDRFPKEVDGLEDRLKSRFGWGLTIAVEPPEFEMRVAILLKKASEFGFILPDEVAFFIAKRLRGNVRDLEGALKRVGAFAQFTQQTLTVDLVKEALKDLLALQQKMVTLENIQKTVADYYKIRVADILSKRRSRNIARPRQMSMAIAKELTNHSLPEIGDAFGGRDHTTVLHAVRKIKELRETDHRMDEDFNSLIRIITN
ncbi:chromosomal replication initiator protein DnaA [Thiomicrorhabdus sp. ZW0627]|uniref:chromosomal replication initiator protein DnaA n=1 Tax=Thiomicrorhabdus sp. ZW0627 TaxID=3039774 RepID=UPI002436A82A|nr:chromosomal replication initiator protein DnaA [Thiomicrorhabdus sp. ZW0627]MDG6774254.1 chromosomal replication initiator protein DnaA [Thiomicrorhabdus sp. ZW0627]